MARRLAAARRVIDHPRVVVSDVEARLGTRYTAETLDRLGAVYPGVRFVWLMGADNLATFHRWDRWADIMRAVPVGVFARPGAGMAACRSVAARRFADARMPAHAARRLPGRSPPAWCYLTLPLVDLSSSELRARGAWCKGEAE